jgi:hypothetical protein
MHPNFTGTWEMNPGKSTIHGSPPQRMVVWIDHREPTLIQEILITSIIGAEQRITFTYRSDAETTNSIGEAIAQSRARWNGSELVIETTMKTSAGEVYFKDHWSLSEDGLTMTMAHRDDALAGQTTVLERSAFGS